VTHADVVSEAERLLAALGAAPDGALLGFCAEDAVRELLNAVNQERLPRGLLHAAARRAAGRWLAAMKAAGALGFNAGGGGSGSGGGAGRLKRVTEGDAGAGAADAGAERRFGLR
jgi:hypothetical protein